MKANVEFIPKTWADPKRWPAPKNAKHRLPYWATWTGPSEEDLKKRFDVTVKKCNEDDNEKYTPYRMCFLNDEE